MKPWAAVPALLALSACGGDQPPADQGVDYAANAARWVDEAFQPSTLSRDEQLAELAWFTEAAAPYRHLEISVVSEALTTHAHEPEVE